MKTKRALGIKYLVWLFPLKMSEPRIFEKENETPPKKEERKEILRDR